MATIDELLGMGEFAPAVPESNAEPQTIVDTLMNIEKDPKVYTEDDALYQTGTKDDSPVYKTADEMSVGEKVTGAIGDTYDYLTSSKNVEQAYGPDVDVVDGKRLQMNNKIKNDMDNKQVQEYLGENLIPSDNPDDKHFYMFEVMEPDGSTSVKMGKAAREWKERYKDQPEVLSRAKLLYDQPLKNTDEVEAMVHGSKWARDNRRVDWGKGKYRGSGATEYYDANSLLFGQGKTGSAPTPTQSKSTAVVNEELSDAQLLMAEGVRDGTTKNPFKPENQKEIERQIDVENPYGEAIKRLPTKELIKQMQRQDDKGDGLSGVMKSMLMPQGSMTETRLENLPQYQEVGRVLNGAGLIDIPSNSTPQQFGQAVSEAMSRVNWNMADLLKTVPDLANKPKLAGAMADAIEMYNTTTTSGEQIARGTGRALVDPANWVTAGGAGIVKAAGKKAATKTLVNTLRGFAEKGLTSNTAKAAGAGAAYGGGYDVGTQQIKVSGERQDKIDLVQALTATGAGAVLGGSLAKVIDIGSKGTRPTINREALQKEYDMLKQRSYDTKDAATAPGTLKKRKHLRQSIARLDAIDKIKDEAKRKIAMEKEHNRLIKLWQDEDYLKYDSANRKNSSETETLTGFNTVVNEDGSRTVTRIPDEGEVPVVETPEPLVKERVKGKNENTARTKGGTDQSGTPAAKEKEIVENKPFEVNDAKVYPKDDIIAEQKNVKPVRRKMRVQYEMGDEGRLFVKEQNLLSHQGTSDQKAKLAPIKDLEVKSSQDTIDELNNRMSFYDESAEARKRYGQFQSRFKKKNSGNLKSQEMANRRSFELRQINDLMKDKKIDEAFKNTLKVRRKELQDMKIVDYAKRNVDEVNAQKRYVEEYKMGKDSHEVREENTYQLARDFEENRAIKDAPDSDKFEAIDKLPADEKAVVDKNTQQVVTRKANEAKAKAVAAHEQLEYKYMLDNGKKWDGQLTADVRKKYRKLTDDIADYRDRQADLAELKDKQITVDELRYREQRRIQKYQEQKEAVTFDTKEELDAVAQKAVDEYAEIGLKVKPKIEMNQTRKEKVKARLKELSTMDVNEAVNKEGKKLKAELSKIEQRERANARNKNKKKSTEKSESQVKKEKAERVSSQKHGEAVEANMNNYLKNRKSGLDEANLHRNDEKGRMGQQKLSPGQKELALWVEEGVLTKKEAADVYAPRDKDGNGYLASEIKDMKKDAEKTVNKKIYDAEAKGLGINTKTKQNPAPIMFHADVVDASNSAAQMMAVLLGSEKMGALAKLTGSNEDIRIIIGNTMEKSFSEADMKTMGFSKDMTIDDRNDRWKELVKYVFMTEQYGQGEKGLVNLLKKQEDAFDTKRAQDFVKKYEAAFKDLAPEFKEFKDAIYKLMDGKNFKKTVEYKLLDDFVVKFDIERMKDGTLTIKGGGQDVHIRAGDVDTASKALMPRMIQSIDGMVMRYLNSKGFHGVHDASFVPKGKSKADVDKAYGKIMSHINNSNLLHDIMTQLGYEGAPLKKGTLTTEQIKASETKLGEEHLRGVAESSKPRKKYLGKRMSGEEVMRDYMASNNHRQIPTNQLQDAMVFEASFDSMSLSNARKSNDVYERQLAMAFQDSAYNPKQALPAPDGVNKAAWDKTQRSIFNEFRAKLEYNHNFKEFGALKGKRKFFDVRGNMLGRANKTMNEIRIEERRRGRKIYKQQIARLSKAQGLGLKRVGKSYESIADKVRRWHDGKPLNADEELAVRIVAEATEQLSQKSWYKSLNDNVKQKEWYAYFERQVGNTERAKEFNMLHAQQQQAGEMVARQEEKLRQHWSKTIPEAQQPEVTPNMLHTDIVSLSDKDGNIMGQVEAAKFLDDHADILNTEHPVLGPVINALEQGAKAIGQPEHQIGFFHDSAIGIANNYGLAKETIPIIDKAMTIYAMHQKNWDWVTEHAQTDWFKDIIKNRQTDKARSEALFENNPASYVKGWIAEVYEGGKALSTDTPFNKTEKPSVEYDTTPGVEQGALPIDLEKLTVGTKLDDVNAQFDKNGVLIPANQEKIKVTKKNMQTALNLRRKITGKKDRIIGDKELRDKLGRSYDATKILAKTTSSIEAKETRRTLVDKIVRDKDMYGNIFSAKPKEGMVKVEPRMMKAMPKELQKVAKYVDKAMYRQILGANKAALNQESAKSLRYVDKIWRDLVLRKKQDVVLKNPSSYVNATMVNQTLGTSMGIPPQEMYRLQKDALRQMNENDVLIEKLALAKAKGEDVAPIEAKLRESALFRMEEAGLATNVIDGVADSTNGMIGNMLSDATGGVADNVMNLLLLNQNAATGKATTKLFSKIDTMGRYQLAQHFMDEGMDINKAVLQANGLMADMNQIAPALIQTLDDYGVAPFAKWFSQSAPMMAKKMKDNPTGVILVALAMYGLGKASDMRGEGYDSKDDFGGFNTSSWSQLESLYDFGEMQTSKGGDMTRDVGNAERKDEWDTLALRELGPFLLPSLYKKPAEVYAYDKDGIGGKDLYKMAKKLIAPNRTQEYKDFDSRGGTQAFVEDTLGLK